MKLADVLPSTADQAHINFTEPKPDQSPYREGDNIFLPCKPDAEFYPLQDGKQFLYAVDIANQYGRHSAEAWFGGTDERPFLVQVQLNTLKTFQEEGEEAFYNALKPKSIKGLEKTLEVPCKRQGDIFAIPLPIRWKEIERYLFFAAGQNPKEWIKDIARKPLFETRHLLSGRILAFNNGRTLAAGFIEAPDHDTLLITGQPHFLAQTANLVDPKKAD